MFFARIMWCWVNRRGQRGSKELRVKVEETDTPAVRLCLEAEFRDRKSEVRDVAFLRPRCMRATQRCCPCMDP